MKEVLDMKDKFLWNARKNGSIRASVVRNFTIITEQGVFVVIAWINDSESIKMGIFDTEPKAQEFLNLIHKQIEED
jgi:hypothetical protein